MENIYCRFCAEPLHTEKFLNLADDKEKLNETLTKLSFLSAIYVDVSNINSVLPKTICFTCYDSLNSAYEFVYKVKNAQDFLACLCSRINEVKKEPSDDEQTPGLNDFEADDVVETPEDVENEICEEEPSINSPLLTVKKELELNTATLFQGTLKDGHSINNCNSNINVQYNLNAPINVNSFSVDGTKSKELTDVCEKSVKSWSDYPWICTYCSIKFIDLETLRSHSKVVHSKCSAFSCVDCTQFDGSFLESSNEDFNVFVNHVRIHWKGLRNRCHYCNILINKPEILNQHVKSHFKESQVPCCHCGEIFNNEEVLQKHLGEYQYVKPKSKPRRKPGQPISIDELTCKHCQKIFGYPRGLQVHLKIHTKDRKKDYTCDRCRKMFFRKGCLRNHIKSLEVRPHQCGICKKSFLFLSRLQNHILIHKNLKPFSCEQCGRCFRLKYQLKCHKIIHTDAKPYVCQYCNKAFRFQQILKNHERQHTGSRPYGCEQCCLQFTNWSNYNKHMKRRHNKDLAKKKLTSISVLQVPPETGQIMQIEKQVDTEERKTRSMTRAKEKKKSF